MWLSEGLWVCPVSSSHLLSLQDGCRCSCKLHICVSVSREYSIRFLIFKSRLLCFSLKKTNVCPRLRKLPGPNRDLKKLIQSGKRIENEIFLSRRRNVLPIGSIVGLTSQQNRRFLKATRPPPYQRP